MVGFGNKWLPNVPAEVEDMQGWCNVFILITILLVFCNQVK